MPEGAPKGSTVADAIELDNGSDSDNEVITPTWPPSRSSVSLSRGIGTREMPRELSDSPPPIIVSSNIQRSPQTARRGRPRTSTTQQRLLRAVQPANDENTRRAPSTASFLNPAPTSHRTAPNLNVQSIRVAPQNGAQQILKRSLPSARNHPQEIHFTPFTSKSPNQFNMAPSRAAGQRAGYEILLRQVVEIIVLSDKQNMPHGQELLPAERETEDPEQPWKYTLAQSGNVVAQWKASTTAELRELVKKHQLYLAFRYLKPTSVLSQPGLLLTQNHYAVLDIQYPRESFFGRQYVVPMNEEFDFSRTVGSALLPLKVETIHFGRLPSLFKVCAGLEVLFKAVQDLNTRKEEEAKQQSLLKRAVDAASALSNAFGMPFTKAESSTASHADPSTGVVPGTWPAVAVDGVYDDDAFLNQMAMIDSAYDDDTEPIDADMREILNNMADGTFHGSDALAKLYGDQGFDVAKLALYSDTESLKKRGLKTPLHDHQLQGLLWMIKAEHRRVSNTEAQTRGLWQTRMDSRGRPYYINLASRECRRTPPVLPRGGINSDSMGLGKTIQIIATCLADRNRVPKGIKPSSKGNEGSNLDEGDKAESSKKVKTKEEEEEDNEGVDSEEDYTSEADDVVEEKKSSQRRRPELTDSSDTEEESDFEVSPAFTRKESHRPTDSEGAAIKSEAEGSSDTETEEDEKPTRGKRKSKTEEDPQVKRNAKRMKEGKMAEEETSKKTDDKDGNTKCSKEADKEEVSYNEATLVICPLSVLQNWTGQVDQHCDKRKVCYYTYHGELAKSVRKSERFATFLSKYNFIFTTYDTVRQEYRVIQKRREDELKRKEKEANRVSTTPESGEEKSTTLRNGKGKGKARDERESHDESEESEYKPDKSEEDAEQSDEKGASKKGKAKHWYDSDDSFLGSDGDVPVTAEPRDTPLFEINWRRIVLDEAHICRNPRTHLYNAICELKGQRRWAVTGTPIVNSTKDLGALAAWCGLQPFAEMPTEWTRVIERPLKKANRSEQAAALLRRVVTSICLRRHKSMKNSQGEPIVKLPDVKFYKHTIPLTAADQDYYTKCETACREHLARWISRGDLNNHRSAILLFLLRLRQMSCHRRLIGSQLLEEIQSKNWDSVDEHKAPMINLTAAAKEELQNKLKIHVEMNDDCPVCMETLLGKEPIITPCGHPFCKACLSAIVGRSIAKIATCPMDRLPLPSMDQMIEMSMDELPTTALEDDFEEDVGNDMTSAKVRECMKIIRATLKKDPTEKLLIFSNFVSFLNIVAEEVKDAEISHARFNGALDVRRRDAVLKSFCKSISPLQSSKIQKNIARLEERLQRERAAQKAALEAATSESGASTTLSQRPKSSSLLLNSLRSVDKDLNSSVQAKANGKGKKRAEDEDIVGENPSVLLISMGCGALGLNLTAASTVILMDPWWQSSLEQQSIDRTHRIGQTREIKVFQIIAENTVEARVLEIQATKEGLAETAFSGIRATGSLSDKRTKVETSLRDLGQLFGMSSTEVQQLSRNAPTHS